MSFSTQSLTNASLTATPLAGDEKDKAQQKASDDSFFGTLIDIVNPLQHIPVVSTLYREATGDTLSSAADIMGGGLFGGPIGAAASAVNAMVTAATGTDITGNAVEQMQALTESSTPQSPYADLSPTMTALAPDRGQAALVIALTGTEQISAEAPITEASNAETVKDTLHSIEQYKDPTLGLKDHSKQEQFRMKLEKIAIDMKA